jgi:Phosphotransferase enzyme family
MSRWRVLKAVSRLIDEAGLADNRPGRLALLWHVVVGALAVALRRQNVAIFLNQDDVAEDRTVLTEEATIADVLLRSIRRRRPVFVVRGTLAPLCRYFGIDHARVVNLRCSSSGLAICFGHLQGSDVVVHAAMNGDEKWVIRQAEGAKIAKESIGELCPGIIDVEPTRLITSRLPGRTTPWNIREDQLQAAISTALEPLKQLFASGGGAGRADEELIASLESYVQKSSRRAQLRPALDLVKHWDRAHIKSVLVHGDYWLNNILFSEGRVSGVVDWDRLRLSGCAGIDALHLAFMSYAVWSGIPVSELLTDLCTTRWHFTWLSSYCALIQEAFCLSAEDLKCLAILLWLSYFPLYDELHSEDEADPRNGIDEWHDQMASPMCKAILEVRRQPAF